MKITRCSLKSEENVTVAFNRWFSFPFPATSVVRFADPSDWHTADHPERITPDVDGECLVMAKYNFLDIVTAGAGQLSTRFGRRTTDSSEPLDITWTNELAVAAMTDGLWCHTANGPQKSMQANQFWVAQIRVDGREGGSVVVQTAEFILTGWHD